MKWFSRFSALMFGLLTLGVVKDLLERNRVLVINDEDEDDGDEDEGPDEQAGGQGDAMAMDAGDTS